MYFAINPPNFVAAYIPVLVVSATALIASDSSDIKFAPFYNSILFIQFNTSI